MIRQPIVSVLGHVDHGKTTLLDRIRGSSIVEKEAGGITQHIGATEIPLRTIEGLCGGLMKQLNIKLTIPGLLFIDTPGHEAFTTLRKRGGALADLAILVVDINEGFQPQTLEAINILRQYKTPFIVAANKIDRLQGWQIFENYPFAHSILKQTPKIKSGLDNKIYELVGRLYELGFECERYDRVTEFEKQISIVPLSAKTGEGIPELLVMLTGLAQKFLGRKLDIDTEKPARGTILEVKEETGLGVTVDVIIYDGKIKVGDMVAIGGKNDVIVTKVRSLLHPKELDEILDPRFKFSHVKEVHAASGVKVAAPNLNDALAGSSMMVVSGKDDKAVDDIRNEIKEIKIEADSSGIIIKADTLGSLEALVNMLKKEEVPIRFANVGDISRRDIVEAESIRDQNMKNAIIMGFNVNVLKDAEDRAKDKDIPIFLSNVIYRLIEEYQEFLKLEEEKEKTEEFDKLTKPVKIHVMPGFVFRSSKPAIVGVEVLDGTLKSKYKLMNKEGVRVGHVKGLQDKNINLSEVPKGKEVACAIDGAIIGKNLNEDDILYSDMTEKEAKLLDLKYKKFLNTDEEEVFEEIKKIKKKENLFWAV